MKIKYIRANPTENITLLVTSGISRKQQPETASKLLRAVPGAEQVGYLEKPESDRAEVRLQMMGGEFCGNAAISAAAKIAADKEIARGNRMLIPIEVSGADGIVNCEIYRDNNRMTGTVEIPLPEKVERVLLEYEEKNIPATVVFLKGITHIIINRDCAPEGYADFAEPAVKEWSNSFREDAVGLILFDEERTEITPLVYVKPTNSLYWEKGCGTGTAAAGIFAALNLGRSINLPVKQPGGVIEASVKLDAGNIIAVSITGSVILEKETEISL